MAWIRISRGLGLALLALLSATARAQVPVVANFQGQPAAAEVRQLARWAADGGNAAGQAFAIVDKNAARIYVFAADGRLAGTAPALLGQARGDESAPGVGLKVSSGIPATQRTTPAGRFESEPGHNDKGEAIVWVDYEAAIAIHRLRPAAANERRPERLSSDTPADNRISLGCIVVAPDFYDAVVAPTLGRRRGIVYVLPDTRGWERVFDQARGPLTVKPS